MKKIRLYHGTVYRFDTPSLDKCKNRKDFGKGFYLADDIGHAKSIAEKGYMAGLGTQKFVYAYDISIQEMRELGLVVHEFKDANYAWLEYVLKNRNMIKTEAYDVVIGPTADANVQKILEAFYIRHELNASNNERDMIINKLQSKVYSRQYCFKTNAAIQYLNKHFIGRRSF